MTSEETERAAKIIDDRRRLKDHLQTLNGAIQLLAGYRRNSCTNTNIDYAFPLDQQGREELKVFLDGQFHRRISEIEDELDRLGVEI